MSDPLPVLDDLVAESDELDALVAGLSDAEWKVATPAEGWTVAHQVAHLAWTDRVALTAVTDPEAFAAHVAEASARP
ncbi:maleylpyruvate isomerase family mycothiol-dependent enzyme, partial [Streptomyces fulvissimus]|nr:maleylpyruvate isomerase family mycothiol-dependent enzyme [Streptomyces microflavus]